MEAEETVRLSGRVLMYSGSELVATKMETGASGRSRKAVYVNLHERARIPSSTLALSDPAGREAGPGQDGARTFCTCTG
jgi:hypothetical protein